MIRKVRINELLSISGTPRTAFPTRNHYVLQIRHDKQTAGASPRPTRKVTFCGASEKTGDHTGSPLPSYAAGTHHFSGGRTQFAPTVLPVNLFDFRDGRPVPYGVDDNSCCFSDSRKGCPYGVTNGFCMSYILLYKTLFLAAWRAKGVGIKPPPIGSNRWAAEIR